MHGGGQWWCSWPPVHENLQLCPPREGLPRLVCLGLLQVRAVLGEAREREEEGAQGKAGGEVGERSVGEQMEGC